MAIDDHDPFPRLQTGQTAQLRVYDLASGRDDLVLETDTRIEAPNWTADGRYLIVNADGRLFRVPLDAPALDPIAFAGLPPINNDHVLDPDGRHVLMSAMDFQLYRGLLDGGEVQRITDPLTSPYMHFLHGVSPDGSRLAFVGLVLQTEPETKIIEAELHTIASSGADHRPLTATGTPSDGPEYSPDGQWIYCNTEAFSPNAQIARVRSEGGELERLVTSTTVDWFPHLSPDGAFAVYLSYPAGTTGHPADEQVSIELVEGGRWQSHRTIIELHGGQGTINVNSWAPGSDRFAYVAYPVSDGAR